MESKKDIRKCVLAERNLISEIEWTDKSDKVSVKVTTHPLFVDADEIYCYIDFRNEVGTKKIIETAWKMGKKVACPKIKGDYMNFYYIKSYNDLLPGNWGILEPAEETLATGLNVLVIMPGAAFDCKKNRVGYGKGYYDQYLDKHPDYQTMALAFELQMVDNIPAYAHDISPQIIVTEEHIYV